MTSAELRTDLQRDVLGTVAFLALLKARAGESTRVTTRELTAELGRVGQVVGHSAGELTQRGLLIRVAPATYALTRRGLDAIDELDGWQLHGRTIRRRAR